MNRDTGRDTEVADAEAETEGGRIHEEARHASGARAVEEPAPDLREEARGLLELGLERIRAQSYAPAEAALLEALSSARRADDSGLMADILSALIRCAFFEGEMESALMRGVQALPLAQESGDVARLTIAHNDLGLVYGRLGELESALDHLRKGLSLLHSEGRDPTPELLNNVGNIYAELDEHGQALEFFVAAAEEFRKIGARRQEAIARGNIGRALLAAGDSAGALESARRSVELFSDPEDPPYLAPALARLGTTLAAAGDIDRARAAFRDALGIVEASSRGEFLDEVLGEAGLFHLGLGELEEAILLLERAISLLPGDETSRRLARLFGSLSEAYERREEFGVALRHLKEKHRIEQSVSDSATQIRIRALALQFELERAKQQEEIFRLRNVELAEANAALRELHEQLEEQNRQLQRISIEDSLTGLYNRRYLELQLPVELSAARRHKRPLSVLLLDIDRFKAVNDEFSHAVGDEVLRRVAALVRQVGRAADLVFRYGGEEFLLLLPDTDLRGAVRLGERIREAVGAYRWTAVHPLLELTISGGAAQLGDSGGPREFIGAADAKLYDAKRAGRNRVRG